MENKKVVIAGGTGFIGQELIRYFGKHNSIIILTRNLENPVNNRFQYSQLSKNDLLNTTFIKWDGRTIGQWSSTLESSEILINLTGQSVNCRYNDVNKRRILDSRTDSVKVLGTAIQQCTVPPQLWINASSATIYPHGTDHPQDEYNVEFKNDFSVQVCKLWEKTFFEQSTPHTRKIALRLAITLGAGGVLIPYFNLLKFGLGGRQGNGKQMFSWVHVEDVCRLIDWVNDNKNIQGIYNCSSPTPVPNKEFMRTLRKVTGNKFGLPAFTWMLKVGAFIIGTETELILKSRWVLPTKILETGFQFKYPLLEDAVAEVISNLPRSKYRLL